MRKIGRGLILAILSVLICLSAVGCQFVDLSIYNPQINSDKVNSMIAATNVEFKVANKEDRVKLSLPEAVEMVERTSVAIEISNQNGSGAGSGVILDVKDSGDYVYIITCHHVISSMGDIVVKLPDADCKYDNNDYIFTGKIGNKIYNDQAVTLVGGDNVSDIAVIKINLSLPALSGNKLSTDKIQKAILPNTEYEIKKGESIFAIGNPSGQLPGSVADGIVSYLDREISVGEVGYMSLMQISVATNPGNSGGGLYNLYGELIGITNAGNTSYDEINFAIPVENEKGTGFLIIASQLIGSANNTNYGYVDGRWSIGIGVENKVSGLNNFIVVSSVEENSNASDANPKLMVGDIITSISFDGETHTINPNNFSGYVGFMRTSLKKGDVFSIFVSRGNFYQEKVEVKVTIKYTDYIFCDTGAYNK